ncbi:MAG: peptide deformylase [Patescibacteria group bacterium]
MIKPFIALPDQNIRQKSKEVVAFDKSIEQIIKDLTETAQVQTDPVALGLAAPQIGVFKRIFVARIRNKFKHFVNPTITKFTTKEATLMEGCFSVPQIYGNTIRPIEVDIKFQDMHGKWQKAHFKGLAAKIVQHEFDHLNGILFIDHVYNQNGKVFKVEKDKKGKEQFVEVPTT